MINQKEIEAMLLQPAEVRFEYAIKRITDSEIVWVVGDAAGYGIFRDDHNNTVFPVWPSEEFAKLCCTGEFGKYAPEAIPLQEFLEENLPGFKDKSYLISVFPLPTGKGSATELDSFIDAIKDEEEKYY